MGGIDWQRRKPTSQGRLLFLLASELGVSSLRQHYHSPRRVVMDWNQIRDYLEDDEISGPRGQSASLRPKKFSFHYIDTASRTANFVGYDSVAGLALL